MSDQTNQQNNADNPANQHLKSASTVKGVKIIKGDKVKSKIEELEHKCQEYLQGWQRARADYDNFKKETEKNIKDLREYLQAETMMEILPIYDHYKLALNHLPKEQEKSEWAQGILHIQREFTDFLKKFAIKEIPTVGQQFDPHLHEAISLQESSVVGEGQIIKEIKPGYKMKEMVLRPAQVIVSAKEIFNNKFNQDSQSERS
ncbi:nucleotide exchange factor GrpE [Patescibacteria group bacterium]|nr:nucleotide exchange factor GrpE [Patescibacteria group bacterium]